MIQDQISVIIPYKEPAPYLDETLDSLKMQSIHADLQIIAIKDDGRGVSGTRNKGLKKALGEFLYFIDADDILFDLDVLRKAREILKNDNKLDYVYGDFIIGDERLRPIRYYKVPLFHEDHICDFLKTGSQLILQPILFRNNDDQILFKKTAEIHEDIDYILRRTYGKTGKYIGIPFIVYREHEASITRSRGPDKPRKILNSLNIYRDFMLNTPGIIKHKKIYKKAMAVQTLLRAHILHTQYYRKHALYLLIKALQYFPHCISLKSLRVLLEFFIPPFIAEAMRKRLKEYRKKRYRSSNL